MKENNTSVLTLIENNLSEIEKKLFYICSVPTYFTLELLDFCLKKLNIYEEAIACVAKFLSRPFVLKEIIYSSKKEKEYYYIDHNIRKSVAETNFDFYSYEEIISKYYETRINAENAYEKKLILREKLLFDLKTCDTKSWRKSFQAAFELERYDECEELLSLFELSFKEKNSLETTISNAWYNYYKLLFSYISNSDELTVLSEIEKFLDAICIEDLELNLYFRSFMGVLYFALKNYSFAKKIFKELFIACQENNSISKDYFCSVCVNLLISCIQDNDFQSAKLYFEYIKNYLPDINKNYEIIMYRALGLLKYKKYNLNESLEYYNLALERIIEFQNKYKNCIGLYDVYEDFVPKILFCMDERHIYDRLGELLLRQGEYGKSVETYNKLIYTNKKYDKIGELWATYNLGRVYCLMGNITHSEELLKTCLKGFEELSSFEGIACVFGELSCIYQYKGMVEESFNALEKCLFMFLQQDKISEVLYYFNRLGRLYQSQGFLEVAHIIFHNCVRKMEYNCGDEHMGWLCINYGRNCMLEHDYDSAYGFLSQAKRIFQKSNNKKGLSFALNNLGELKLKQKRYTQAKKNLSDSLDLKNEMGDKYAICHTLRELGEYFIKVNKLDKAEKHLDDTLEMCQKLGFKEMLGNVYLSYAKLFDKKGCFLLSNKYFRKAIRLFEIQNSPKRLYDCYKLFLDFKQRNGRLISCNFLLKKKLENIEQDYIKKNNYLKQQVELFIEQLNSKIENKV